MWVVTDFAVELASNMTGCSARIGYTFLKRAMSMRADVLWWQEDQGCRGCLASMCAGVATYLTYGLMKLV